MNNVPVHRTTITSPPVAARGLAAERWTVALALLFTMLTLSHFIHDHWYAMDPSPRVLHPATAPAPKSSAAGYAPNVYRVGMPFVVSLVERVLPFHWSVLLTILDVVFGFAALYVLYLVLVHGMRAGPQDRAGRAAVILGYLAAIALPLNWVVSWARPETLPSTLYLALATLCLLTPLPGITRPLCLFLLTLLQGFTRSDVAIAYGASLILAALLPRLPADLGSRRGLLGLGLITFVAAVGTQAYLQLVVFPHSPYPPGTPMVQLPWNLLPHNMNVFLLAVAPFAVAVAAGFWRRQPWQGADRIAMLAAAVYLPIWFLVGSTAEVRIYVPFLLLLAVPVARVAASAVQGETFPKAD